MATPALEDEIHIEEPYELEASSMTRVELVERLGQGAGDELFARLDVELRQGERATLVTVREARKSISVARGSRRARLVKAQRPAKLGDETSNTEMVLIGLSDLEAVVKANTIDFNWANAFAPRRDLPTTTSPLRVLSGARGRKIAL